MADKITRDMTFGELIQQFPDAAPVLANYGLHCIGCHIAVIETVEQGAKAHGLSEEQIDSMIEEMNSKAVAAK